MSKTVFRFINPNLIADLKRLRKDPELGAFTAIVIMFIAFNVWLKLVIKCVDSAGFKDMAVTGNSLEGPVLSQNLPFYMDIAESHDLPIGQSAELSDIAGAMNAAYPDVTPSFLQFDYEAAPFLSLVISGLILCAYFAPALYLLAGIFGKAPRGRLKRALKSIVILGAMAWVTAVTINGYHIRTPIHLALSASFWIVYGGLCCHLFVQPEFKHRKFVQPVMMGVGLFVFAAVKLAQTGQLFSSSTFTLKAEQSLLSDVILTQWWAKLAGVIDWLNDMTSAWPAFIIIAVWFSVDFGLERVKGRQPLTALLMKWALLATLIVCLCGLLGVLISAPRDVLFWQYLFLTIGIGLFNTASQDKAHLAPSRTFIESVISNLTSKSTNLEVTPQEN